MKKGDKLYVVTRRDIPPGYQAVQAAHAYVEFCFDHPRIAKRWHDVSQYMALLSVEALHDLYRVHFEAQQRGIRCTPFYEPDIGMALTAVALEPGPATVDLCKGMPLALSELSYQGGKQDSNT